MSNTNLNDVAVDIIGVVTMFGLTQIYYNMAIIEYGTIHKHKPIYIGYLGLCTLLSTFTAFTRIYKYY